MLKTAAGAELFAAVTKAIAGRESIDACSLLLDMCCIMIFAPSPLVRVRFSVGEPPAKRVTRGYRQLATPGEWARMYSGLTYRALFPKVSQRRLLQPQTSARSCCLLPAAALHQAAAATAAAVPRCCRNAPIQRVELAGTPHEAGRPGLHP